MSRLRTSIMGTTTRAISTAPAIVAASVILAALAMATSTRLNQREGFTSVAGQDCKLNWI